MSIKKPQNGNSGTSVIIQQSKGNRVKASNTQTGEYKGVSDKEFGDSRVSVVIFAEGRA